MAHTSRGTLPSSVFGSLSSTYTALLAADAFYKVDFIAQNNSGVEGGAFLALDNETHRLTVITGATGVEPGQIHPQHIHGFPSANPANARPASIAQDDDTDGFVELAEGAETAGPPLLNLSRSGGETGFPTPSGRNFVFTRTYDLDELTFDANPSDGTPGVRLSQILTAANLDERLVELHGLTLRAGQGENGGEADGTAGYKTLLPIAGGEIQRLTHEDVALYFSSGAFPVGDKVAALDIQGNSGQAYRLYDIFNREPDIRGLSGWVESLDQGVELTDVARSFLVSNEFTRKFGALNTLSNQAFVEVLYENVLERSGEAAGVSNWIRQLDAGLSREDAFVAFSESPENQRQVAPLLANGILLSESILT